MNDSNSGGLIAILWIVTVAISIISGILSWNWIEPDSFFGAIIFLIVWGLMSKVGHFIAMAIFASTD